MPLKADLKASKLFPCQLKLLITMDLLNLSIYPPFSDERMGSIHHIIYYTCYDRWCCCLASIFTAYCASTAFFILLKRVRLANKEEDSQSTNDYTLDTVGSSSKR